MDLYREIKMKKDANGKQQKQNEEELIIMTKGKSIDYFILIIEGENSINYTKLKVDKISKRFLF